VISKFNLLLYLSKANYTILQCRKDPAKQKGNRAVNICTRRPTLQPVKDYGRHLCGLLRPQSWHLLESEANMYICVSTPPDFEHSGHGQGSTIDANVLQTGALRAPGVVLGSEDTPCPIRSATILYIHREIVDE